MRRIVHSFAEMTVRAWDPIFGRFNDLAIGEGDRLFRWPLGVRPEGHKGHEGLEELGL